MQHSCLPGTASFGMTNPRAGEAQSCLWSHGNQGDFSQKSVLTRWGR